MDYNEDKRRRGGTKMKKSTKIVASSSLILSLLLTGCGTPKESGEKSAEKEKGGEVTEIEIWSYLSDSAGYDFLQETLQEWGAENGYTFKFVAYPYADLNKQYTLGMVSGELPDIAMVNNCDTANFVEMGMLQDITEQVEAWGEADNFYESAMNTTTVDGKIYGLPYNSNCLALFYDEDALAAAGVEVPTTWEELKAASLKLKGEHQYGMAMSLTGTDEGTFQYFPFLYSSGADMYSLNSEEGIASMSYLKDMMDEGGMSTEVINWSQADVCQQFIQGNAAMMINGPWQIPELEKSAPDKNWNCTKIPVDKEEATALGGEGFSIVEGADVEKVWPVLEYMMSREFIADWTKASGQLPSRKDSMEMYPEWKEDPQLQVFFDGLEYAAVLGPEARWSEISTAIYKALQETMTGQKTPEQACSDAQSTIDGLVE